MAQEGIDWTALFSGAGAAKAIDIVYQLYKERSRRKVQASEAINSTVKIYTALAAINTHQCIRRCVLKAHNSGGALNTRTHKKVSMLYEDFYEPFTSDIANVNDWRMDEAYTKMLLEVTRNKVARIVTAEMHPCELKDLYESKGITYSEVHYLGEDGKELFFMSFSTNRDIREWNPVTKSEIKVCVDRITKLLHL